MPERAEGPRIGGDVYDLFRPLGHWCYICQRPHPDCDPDRFDIPCACTLEQSCPDHVDDDDEDPCTCTLERPCAQHQDDIVDHPPPTPYHTPTVPAFSPNMSEQPLHPGRPTGTKPPTSSTAPKGTPCQAHANPTTPAPTTAPPCESEPQPTPTR